MTIIYYDEYYCFYVIDTKENLIEGYFESVGNPVDRQQAEEEFEQLVDMGIIERV